MNDNIDKNEIRRAIDRLQIEHPCDIAYDPAAFVNMEAVNTIKECVDKIARRMVEDTEINIICEFAKLYLEGVRPMIMPEQDWIPCSEELPEDDKEVLVYVRRKDVEKSEMNGLHIAKRHQMEGDPEGNNNFWGIPVAPCEWRIDGWSYFFEPEVLAWMPLPEPYKQDDEHGN